MAGGSEDSFVEPLGYMLMLTALIALTLSYAKQSTIVAFIAAGAALNAVFGAVVDAQILGHFSEVGILVLLFMAGLEVELEAFLKSWRTVTIVGMGQIVVCTACSALLSLAVLPAVGASKVDSNAAVYFGLCMTFSSTILVLGSIAVETWNTVQRSRNYRTAVLAHYGAAARRACSGSRNVHQC